ncbi:MAG: phytanoyl-CoA dioxygenase family protein [Pseudomonadota bacterium]
MKRFTDEQIQEWHTEGGVLLTNFFTADEIEPCRADMEQLYGDRQDPSAPARVDKEGNQIGLFSRDQFRNFDDMPFDCSPALNLLALHPAMIALAQAALGTSDVHLYQSHSWAKFTGEADFDQLFHCDFKNHTLTVPAGDAAQRTINCMIYMTDVTDAHGAIHYVPLSQSNQVCGDERDPFGPDEVQGPLKSRERSGAGPAGSVFAYGIDVYHRGTNLTLPGGVRYTLTASFKAAGNDMIGWSAWPISFLKPWHIFFEHCSPEQLSCIGVPKPGDSFWTERTIQRTKKRWPVWNEQPYLAALCSTDV